MYFETVRQMKKMLGQLDKWLEAAAAFAQTKKFDPNVFLTLRLAPDQFPFVKQVQTACDTAKLVAARLAGKEAPSHPDTEQTLDELRARIAHGGRLPGGLLRGGLRGGRHPGHHPAAVGGQSHVGRGLLPGTRPAELLLPPHPRLRHPPPQRRRSGQARLPGPAQSEAALRDLPVDACSCWSPFWPAPAVEKHAARPPCPRAAPISAKR